MKVLVLLHLRTLILLLVCATCLLITAPRTNASPLYLAQQRAGQTFAYEARRSSENDYDSMLDSSSYNYPYAFTEDMNTMIKSLFAHETLYTLADSIPKVFDDCVVESDATPSVTTLTKSGCYKTLLHAGIAGDCVAANPLCCVLYWRYPAGLSDRLPVTDIDPKLIFWDGSKAVNGFYTNFSLSYRANYSDCAALPTWPAGNTAADGVALSVDSRGEWRFTRRVQPVLSFVEHHVDRPDGQQATAYAALRSAGEAVWSKQGQFADVSVVAPIVVCAGLLLACLVLLLLAYCCTVPSSRREQAALRELIEALEVATAEQESEICRRRTRSEKRLSSQLGKQTPHGSFATSLKSSPSPVDLHRSLNASSQHASQLHLLSQRRASVVMSASPSVSPATQQQPRDDVQVFSPAPYSPSGRTTPVMLSRQGSQSQIAPPTLQKAMSSSRRASITPDHRRPSMKKDNPQQLLSQRVNSSATSRNGSFAGGAAAPRSFSRNSSLNGRSSNPMSPEQRASQSFANPLLGRQSFQ